MNDCDDLIDDLHDLTVRQIDLALGSVAAPVAAMHIDLAVFGTEQARYVEEVCDDE